MCPIIEISSRAQHHEAPASGFVYFLTLPQAQKSPYLRKHLRPSSRDGVTRIELPDHSRRTTSLYTEYLKGSYCPYFLANFIRRRPGSRMIADQRHALSWKECKPLIEAHVFGFTVGDAGFQDWVMDELDRCLDPEQEPDLSILVYVFHQLGADAHLKNFVVDRMFQCDGGSLEMAEVLRSRVLRKKCEDWSLGAGCEYHVHAEGTCSGLEREIQEVDGEEVGSTHEQSENEDNQKDDQEELEQRQRSCTEENIREEHEEVAKTLEYPDKAIHPHSATSTKKYSIVSRPSEPWNFSARFTQPRHFESTARDTHPDAWKNSFSKPPPRLRSDSDLQDSEQRASTHAQSPVSEAQESSECAGDEQSPPASPASSASSLLDLERRILESLCVKEPPDEPWADISTPEAPASTLARYPTRHDSLPVRATEPLAMGKRRQDIDSAVWGSIMCGASEWEGARSGVGRASGLLVGT